jgi:hypothetical protein
MFSPVCGFGADAGGALCAGIALRATVAVERQGKRGVSDPHLAAPFFAPHPAPRGSLTPHVQCHDRPARQRRADDTVECAALSMSTSRAVHFSHRRV